MPKAKTKELAVVKTDPRSAMLNMRAVVKTVVNAGKRADLIPANEADKDRIIIALQDQLEDSKGRHQRATRHIASAIHIMDLTGAMLNEATEQALINLDRAQQAESERNLAQERINDLQDDLYEVNQERKAALTTLKSVMLDG